MRSWLAAGGMSLRLKVVGRQLYRHYGGADMISSASEVRPIHLKYGHRKR